MIALEDVSVSLGGVSILGGIDLELDRGEFVGLIGPNGAGKTTLLRTINGILDPDAGDIWIDEQSVSDLTSRELSRRVATVPQDTHVGFAFTVEQVVEMGRTPHRSRLDWSDDGAPVDRALERTDTDRLRDRTVGDLSGGERQRVLLARALAQQPDALLLDEPTASLDINHQVRVLELAADLVADGRATLAAIHDLDLAAQFCDRLVLVHDGSIQAQGPPESVLRGPQLDRAFETATAITADPVTGAPRVTAVDDRPSRSAHVHVVGGGESGLRAVRTLWRAGFEVSVGPVPDGDVVARLADQLDLSSLTVPAFEQPDESVLRDTAAQTRSADIVVVTDEATDQVDKSVDAERQIHAALTGDSPAVARGDGGQLAVVETESALLTAVESHGN